MNNTGFSEYSQGGITSKRSHKHLLDSASQPIQSKQDVSDDEEPIDPMHEEANDFASMNNQLSKRGEAKPTAPSYELDLRDYMHQQQHQQHQ